MPVTSTAEKPAFEILGIKFAPLNVSIQRRFQTLSVANSVFVFLLSPFIPFIFYYIIFHTTFWFLVPIYICWFIYDKNTPEQGGRKYVPYRRNPFCYGLRDYFPVKLIKTAELPANRNYLFCAHPHGVICYGVVSNFSSDCNIQEVFPHLDPYVFVAAGIFNVPIVREMYIAKGTVAATEKSMMNILSREEKGKIGVLVVGGASEAKLSEPGTNKVILNKRKGFVKVALKSGASLVPVYSFGENDIGDQLRGKNIRKFQDFVQKWTGIAPIVPLGRGIFQYSFGAMPHRNPITTVVGEPIPVPKMENPTEEAINQYHEKYKMALIKLFNENKEKYDGKGSKAELMIL